MPTQTKSASRMIRSNLAFGEWLFSLGTAVLAICQQTAILADSPPTATNTSNCIDFHDWRAKLTYGVSKFTNTISPTYPKKATFYMASFLALQRLFSIDKF